jgi:hypothetical protein
MSAPTRRLSLPQFQLLLADASVLTRTIDAVHVHHTWHPSRSDFRGAETIEAMRRVHIAQGWIDIAQHVTIDPTGGIWTGRNWNLPPASSKGHNGTIAAGPFMLEIVGNFDTGHDPFDGEQRDTAAAVVAHLLSVFTLDFEDVKFHRELVDNQKTCPGSGFDRQDFEKRIGARKRKGRWPRPVFARDFLLGASLTRAATNVPSESEIAEATVPEHRAAAAAIAADARARIARAQRRYSTNLDQLLDEGRTARADDWTALKPHVVNLAHGELSESGAFTTTPADVDAIVEAIRDRAAADPSLRVLLYAHGGLVDERSALDYAKRMYQWWLSKGVYPVFFVWETGLFEILRQQITGRRDLADWTSDLAIEIAAKAPGTQVWSKMKDSARRASAADLGEGFPGGAHLFASRLASVLKSAPPTLSVHAIGHSAGAIFHAHLLPEVARLSGRPIASLSLFAPAARAELFKETLLPMIGDRTIEKHTCFTMEEEAEEQDDCWRIYRKSLLYLVSHSFEGLKRRPILGLHRSMRKDADLRALYGLDEDGRLDPGASPAAELQLSYTRDKTENPLTRALAHGAFDNDPKTVSAALRRILQVGDETGLGEADFPYPPLPRAFAFALDGAVDAPAASAPSSAASSSPAPGTRARRLALCIGIDEYRDNPLAGCVNDARAWGRTLDGLGFDVRYLLDAQATNRGILDALADLMSGSRAGDVLVLQYAGHGTQLPDDSGDEDDRFDEAFVPVDYHTGAVFLRDDIVATALSRLPRGVLLTLFFDCCHCGTISRFAPAVRGDGSTADRVRYLELPPGVVAAARASRSGSRAKASLPQSAPGVIHLAACRDNEFAWESNGAGDFTSAATRVLGSAVGRGATNESFIAEVAKAVVKKRRQHPLMLPPPAGLAQRPLLQSLGAGSGSAGVTAPASDPEADALAHLETAIRLLRQQAT